MPDNLIEVLVMIAGLLTYIIPYLLKRKTKSEPLRTGRKTEFYAFADEYVARLTQESRACTMELSRIKTMAVHEHGPVRVLVDTLDKARQEQDYYDRQLEQAQKAIEAEFSPGDLSELERFLAWQRFRLGVMEQLIAMRMQPATAELLADADALAQAHLQPIQDFARAHGIAMPLERPVTATAAPHHEAILFGLLSDKHPLVLVPQDFGQDIFRWSSVAHEIAHSMWRGIPGLAHEIRAKQGLQIQPKLLGTFRQPTLTPLFSAWLEEIFCDLVTIVQLGPAGLRGLLESFMPEQPGDNSLRWVSIDENTTYYEEHPPTQLRVRMATAACESLGYRDDALLLLKEWETRAGVFTEYAVPINRTDAVLIHAERLDSEALRLIQEILAMQLESLKGFTLEDIPGFSMTHGRWSKALEAIESLELDKLPDASPTVLIAAAIQVRAKSSASSSQLSRLITESIRGIDEPVRKPAKAPEDQALDQVDDEFVEAIILFEALSKRQPYAMRTASNRL